MTNDDIRTALARELDLWAEAGRTATLWWRDDDGDLTDALVDALRNIEAGAPVWLLTPKAGRPGHVAPGEVQESAEIVGLRVMSSLSLAADALVTKYLANDAVNMETGEIFAEAQRIDMLRHCLTTLGHL